MGGGTGRRGRFAGAKLQGCDDERGRCLERGQRRRVVWVRYHKRALFVHTPAPVLASLSPALKNVVGERAEGEWKRALSKATPAS